MAKQTWAQIAAQRPDDASTRLLLAELYRKHKFKAEAIEQYEKAIELVPQNQDYKEYLGEYYYKHGEKEKALAMWNRMVEGELATGANYSRLAELLWHRDFKDDALTASKKAVQIQPQEFRWRQQLATILIEREAYDEALVELEQTAKVAPNEFFKEQTQDAMLEVYRKQGVLAEKIKQLEAAPENVENLRTLAKLYSKQGNVTKVLENLSKVDEIDPQHIPTLRWQAELYQKEGMFAKAIEANEHLVDADKANAREYYATIAQIYSRLGKRDEAEKSARQAIALSPRNPEGYRMLAEIATQWGDAEEAITHLQRALKLQPNDIEISRQLAQAYQDASQFRPAALTYWRCWEMSEDAGSKLAFVKPLFESYSQMNRVEELLERFQTLSRREPTDIHPILALAEIAKLSGDLKSARSALVRALSQRPEDANLLRELVQLAENFGDEETAIDYQRKLVSVEPSRYNQRRLGELLYEAGLQQEAEQIWSKLALSAGDTAEAYIQLAKLLARYDLMDEAAVALKQAAEKKPSDPKTLYAVGAAYVAIDQPQLAAPYFRKLIYLAELPPQPTKRQPKTTTSPMSWYPPGFPAGLLKFQQLSEIVHRLRQPGYYGRALWTPGTFEEIKAVALVQLAFITQREGELEKFLSELESEQGLRDLRGLTALAGLYIAFENAPKALNTLERMQKIAPEDISTREALFMLLAMSGQLDRAKKEMEYITAKKPESKYWYMAMTAAMLWETGKREEGQQMIDELMREEISDPYFLTLIPELLVQMEKYDEAKQILAKAMVVQKTLPAARTLGGNIHYTLGQLADAFLQRGEFEASMELYLQFLEATKPGTTTGTMSSRSYSAPGQEYPAANFYFDRSRLETLKNMYQASSTPEQRQQLFATFETQFEQTEGKEKVYPALALSYFHWWASKGTMRM